MHVGTVPVDVRVARLTPERERGLSGVAALAEGEGMLFVYRDRRTHRFWMSGCLIQLDIAFVDTDGTVVQIDTLDPPVGDDDPARTRQSPPVQYVLEVPGGFFARHGLRAGVRVHLPATIDVQRADP